jgi:hypothetical protein
MLARSLRVVGAFPCKVSVLKPFCAVQNPVRKAHTVTIEEAKNMPRLYRQMPNDILLTMAVMGDQEAREERLIRDIMAVDSVTW